MMYFDVLCIKTVSWYYIFFRSPISIWAAITKFHRLGDMQTTEIYFSQSWRLEVQDPGLSIFSIFLISQMTVFLLCLHMVEELRDLSGISFIKAPISFMRTPPQDLTTSQRPHLQILSYWGLDFNAGSINIQSIAPPYIL